MAKKIYEIEIQRTNISPRQFFTYCKNQAEKKGTDLRMYIDEFELWENPIDPCNDTWTHDDWDEPQREICKIQSFDYHLYLQNSYNFIMEFEFDTETKGHGYLYIVEFER